MVVPSQEVVLVAPFLEVVHLVAPFQEVGLLEDHAYPVAWVHQEDHEVHVVPVVHGHLVPYHVAVHSLDQMVVFQKGGLVAEGLSCLEGLSFQVDPSFPVDLGILAVLVVLDCEMVEAWNE